MNSAAAPWARLPLVLLGFVLRTVLRRPRNSLAAGVAGFAAIAILVNALFMQSGPHPAPIFANKPAPVAVPLTGPAAALAPQRKPPTPRSTWRGRARTWSPRSSANWRGMASMTARPMASMARRPMRRSATSSRRRACVLRPSRTTCCSPRSRARPSRRSRSRSSATIRSRRCWRPTPRIVAVQRALTDFGYGPVKPTGSMTPRRAPPSSASRRRGGVPVTGQITDQLVRDLAALTGRPLE